MHFPGLIFIYLLAYLLVFGVRLAAQRWPGSIELRLARPRLPDASSAPEVPEPSPELAQAQLVLVLPLYGHGEREGDDPALRAIGLACSRLVIRSLMLMPGLSVRGPEDTPFDAVEKLEHVPAALRAHHHVVGGVLARDGAAYRVSLWLGARDGTERRVELQDRSLANLVQQITAACALWIAKAPSADALAPHAATLAATTPTDADDFRALGEALLAAAHSTSTLESDEALLSALDRGPRLSVAASGLSHYHVRKKLDVARAAGCDAQLDYSLAQDDWQGAVGDGTARSFLVRALELAPAHGRANVSAFLLAAHPQQHAQRTQAGYALLPLCAYGAHCAATYWLLHSQSAEPLCAIARTLIELAPDDPLGRQACMVAYDRAGDRARALEAAHRLLRLVDPISAQARRHIRADRRLQLMLTNGWDPIQAPRELIDRA